MKRPKETPPDARKNILRRQEYPFDIIDTSFEAIQCGRNEFQRSFNDNPSIIRRVARDVLSVGI